MWRQTMLLLLSKYWKYIASILAALALVWGIYHHGYKSGVQAMQSICDADKANLAMTIEQQRANDQAAADAKNEEMAITIQNLLAQKDLHTEVINNEVSKNSVYNKCIVTPDGV